MYYFPKVTANIKVPQLCDLTQQNLETFSSSGFKSEIKMPAQPHDLYMPHLRTLPFLPCLSIQLPVVSCQSLVFLEL